MIIIANPRKIFKAEEMRLTLKYRVRDTKR